MPTDKPAWERENLQSPHHVPDKADRVRRMFDAVAPRYELINTLFSAGRDAAWRRIAVRLASVQPDDEVLDVACGTGDFARAFLRAGPRRVVGCDFAHEMLIRAAQRPSPGAAWCRGDALRLPFHNGSFSIASCAFGIRNFQDLLIGLKEMHRVLRPGGRCVILEFSRPKNRLARGLYELYTHRLMPVLASWISRDRVGAYRYLPRSVVSFHDPEQTCAMLVEAGFASVATRSLTMGAVTVYVARRD